MGHTADNPLITLDLDPGEPISGRLTRGDGEPEPFEGLLELIVALDRARTVDADSVAQQDS